MDSLVPATPVVTHVQVPVDTTNAIHDQLDAIDLSTKDAEAGAKQALQAEAFSQLAKLFRFVFARF